MALKLMNENEIKNILLKNLLLDAVYVSFYEKNCQIIAIGHIFYNMHELERHKMIYAPLMQHISNNEIHSVSIQAFNPEEWNKKRILYNI